MRTSGKTIFLANTIDRNAMQGLKLFVVNAKHKTPDFFPKILFPGSQDILDKLSIPILGDLSYSSSPNIA